MWHKCERCGCSLDPGEGRICEDCREEQEKATDRKRIFSQQEAVKKESMPAYG